MSYDVAIIGGGLSGLALSIELARKGHSVALVEMQRYPFHRVCGEYISNESRTYLEHLGIDLTALGARDISQFRLTVGSGASLNATLPLGGFGISRHRLDQELASVASAAGVDVRDGVKVLSASGQKLETTQGELSARLIVGAHGKRSAIDKQLDRQFIQRPLDAAENFIGVKYHVKADLPKEMIELHVFRGGYCGISAVEDDAYCMCYLSRASNLKKGMTIDDMEREVLSKNPVLGDYIQRFERLWEAPKVISQVNFQNKKRGEGGLQFVGDAAGLIAPLSGNGMSMALHSAHLFASQAHHFLAGEASEAEMAQRFDQQWKKAFGQRFTFARSMQAAFFTPWLMHGLLKSANLFPPLAQLMIRQTHGKPFFKHIG